MPVVDEGLATDFAARRIFRATSEAEVEPEGEPGFREWAERIPEPKGGRLRFDYFPYQVELYGGAFDEAREAGIMKSTQVGVSELCWRWAARRSDRFGDTTLYIFPTDTHVRAFGDERIEPAIQASEYLLSRIDAKSVKHKTLKNVGRGFMHLRGSNSRAGAQSVPADAIVFDEYDELDSGNVVQIERRLSGSQAAGRVPRTRRIGIPSVPNFGISKVWDRSDKRRWYVTCAECDEQQPLDFASNVRWANPGSDRVCKFGDDEFDDPMEVERAWRVCRKCEAEINVAEGEWIRTDPGRSIPGWHVTRLIVPLTDLEEIVKNSRKTEPHEVEAFWNNDLGEPYSSTESSLDLKVIARACSLGVEQVDRYVGRNPVVAGIDVAGTRPLNVSIVEILPDDVRQALWIGTVENFQGLMPLMDLFGVHVAAVDGNPERRQAMAFAATFPGRVVLCEYTTEPRAQPIDYKPEQNMVRVQRTLVIDAMMDSIRSTRYRPVQVPPAGYTDHLRALHRRIEMDARGRPRATYISTGPDDWAHAECFALVATEMWRLSLHINAQQQAMEGQVVADEELGFERVDLDSGDSYYPGFGGGDF